MSFALAINFKDERTEKEFPQISPVTRAIILEIAHYAYVTFGIIVTITHLLRTQGEQNEFYANNPSYKKRPWISVHQISKGGDIRTINPINSKPIFTPEQIKKIEHHINSRWQYDPTRPKKKVVIDHNIGHGAHLHVQTHSKTCCR